MDVPGELIGWQAVILHLLLSNLEPNLLQSGLGKLPWQSNLVTEPLS